MEGINPQWSIWILQEQRKYNMILAFGTIIIALVGILQLIKLYEVFVPDFILFGFALALTFLVMIILLIAFERQQ